MLNGGDLVGGEEDAIASVAAHRPCGDAFAPEGFRHFPEAAAESHVILGRRNGSHDLVLAIVDLGQSDREGTRARPVAADAVSDRAYSARFDGIAICSSICPQRDRICAPTFAAKKRGAFHIGPNDRA